MKKILNILAGLVLVGLFVVPILFINGLISESSMKLGLLVGTVLWFIAMIPRMRGGGPMALIAVAGIGWFTLDAHAGPEAVASGALGYVNAENGDSMWDAIYYAHNGFEGERRELFEKHAGEGISHGGDGRFSARWTATVAARQDGIYRLTLRSSEPASVTLDGDEVLILPKGGDVSADLPLRDGVSQQMAVHLPDADTSSQLALEWELLQESEATVVTGHVEEVVLGPNVGARIGNAGKFENARFGVELAEDGRFTLIDKEGGKKAEFSPEFLVVARPVSENPEYQARGTRFSDDGPVGNTNYFVPVWNKNPDYLAAAQPRKLMRPSGMSVEDNGVSWNFDESEEFRFSARLELPTDGGEPVLRYKLEPKMERFFSVGYAGAPQVDMEAAEWIWQPLVWTGRRFPNQSYLTPEYQCPIPFVLAGMDDVSVGVGVEPSEMPFRMPVGEDSRFGVMLRNANGHAQPQVFAPILGGIESKRNADEKYEFALRLFVGGDDWYESYRDLAGGLYRFDDLRENALGSLNETIDNMAAFFLTEDFSYWDAQHKSWGYQNDLGPEGIRQQSAAYPMSLALVLDNPEILHKRAIPTLEYMLTRNRSQAKSSDTDLLGGPNKIPLDWIPTHRLLLKRNDVLRAVAEKTSPVIHDGEPKVLKSSRGQITEDRNTLLHALAVYRLNGDARWLDLAKKSADRYIDSRVNRPAETFEDAQSSFWTELSAAYDGLYELYEETGEKRYLSAAHDALAEFTAYVYLTPVIPDAPFLANPGGQHRGVEIAEETVPAWRVSPNGLTAECAATAHSHRGIFMAPYAGYMLRLAQHTDDNFLRNIARNAIVGRYLNYPAYAYRNGFSTIFEKADFPLRSFEDIKKVTSAHYNHPLPMTAFLVDYLVSDVEDRSGGEIAFPSEYTNTGAYFRTRVYGAQAGSFFDVKDAFLWMPAGLLKSGSIQLNYLAARAGDTLCVAFSNQSDEPIETWIQINPELAAMPGEREARTWTGSDAVKPTSVVDGRVTISVPAKGLVALAIPDVTIRPRIQDAMLDPSVPGMHAKAETFDSYMGKIHVTPLTYGRGLTMVHVLIASAPDLLKKVTLRHSAEGEEVTLLSDGYPHEFTIPVPDSLQEFTFEIEGVRADDMELTSGLTTVRVR